LATYVFSDEESFFLRSCELDFWSLNNFSAVGSVGLGCLHEIIEKFLYFIHVEIKPFVKTASSLLIFEVWGSEKELCGGFKTTCARKQPEKHTSFPRSTRKTPFREVQNSLSESARLTPCRRRTCDFSSFAR
jgi:hypothetical protein